MREVVVEAPASSANLGPGFDALAVALDRPRDRLRVSVEESDRVEVDIGVARGIDLPLDPEENVAGVVAREVCRSRRKRGRIRIFIEKKVPPGLGLGSSAASAAACAVALDRLFGLGLSKEAMVGVAGRGEGAVSGAAHYDNASAAVFGGFVVVKGGGEPSVVRLEAPEALRLCVATPILKLPRRKTEYARSVLPKSVTLGQMVSNVGNASAVVAGFARGDIALIGSGMEDAVVEPARAKLIPGYGAVRELAVEAGASGACISGAGPTLLAAVDARRSRPEGVLEAMLGGFRESGVRAEGFVARVGDGARVVGSS